MAFTFLEWLLECYECSLHLYVLLCHLYVLLCQSPRWIWVWLIETFEIHSQEYADPFDWFSIMRRTIFLSCIWWLIIPQLSIRPWCFSPIFKIKVSHLQIFLIHLYNSSRIHQICGHSFVFSMLNGYHSFLPIYMSQPASIRYINLFSHLSWWPIMH